MKMSYPSVAPRAPEISFDKAPAHDTCRPEFPAFSLKKFFRRFLFKSLLQARARRLAPKIIDSLHECSSMLDLGCGDMILTEFLQHHSPLQVTAVDTVDTNLSSMPVILYDGNRIPFPENTFDATVVAYMLHHCNNIEAILHEIKRVTCRKIIVMEEVFESKFAEKVLHLHDNGNKFLSTKMKIPLNFMKIQQWHETFNALDLKVEQCTRIYQYPWVNITHQVLFELRV
ncbi:MAG: methyltransferase domain-containing protein [Chitinivibrionales bacterium]|nr:methyltransferase domain-containing protein [Chitinivibrionales bacterium]